MRERSRGRIGRSLFRRAKGGRTTAVRGQSLVEFAVVLPMLLILLLGVADFGRIFSAGITLEAAARNAAEAAALERLRTGPSATPGEPAFYQRLHEIAAKAACAEARSLPNTTYVPDDPATTAIDEESCPADFTDTSTGNDGPVIAVCVLDDVDPLVAGAEDPNCGGIQPWLTGAPPATCSLLSQPWTPVSGGSASSHAVEVRTCYHFTTLFNLRVSLGFGWGLSLGDVWLQRQRMFVIDCPPGDVSTC